MSIVNYLNLRQNGQKSNFFFHSDISSLTVDSTFNSYFQIKRFIFQLKNQNLYLREEGKETVVAYNKKHHVTKLDDKLEVWSVNYVWLHFEFRRSRGGPSAGLDCQVQIHFIYSVALKKFVIWKLVLHHRGHSVFGKIPFYRREILLVNHFIFCSSFWFNYRS